MDEVNNVSGGSGFDFAAEVYRASLAKTAQQQEAQQALELLKEAVVEPVTPAASSGSHMTTDNLGQNININV